MSAPTVTVKDVWRSVLPEGTELLAGGAGLERRVEWACALRTRPPAFDAVKGGEVAFIPVRSIRLLDERLDLAQVMTSFAEKGGVAIAVLGDASAQSITIADRLMMPLFRLPEAVHINDAHQACVRFILDQRTLLHERAQELQMTLMQLALSGAGPPAIVERLAEITALTTVLLDERGSVVHASGPDAERVSEAIAAEIPALRRWGDTVPLLAADPPVRELVLSGADMHCVASPIPSRDGVGGFVAVAGAENQLDQMARLALARTASACAIELDRERAVTETREHLEGEFIESLLSGTYSSEDVVAERARRLGVEIAQSVVVFAFRGSRVDNSWEETALRAARNTIARRETDALVAGHEGAVCAVVISGTPLGDAATGRLAEAVRADVARATGDAATSAGIGRTGSGAASVRASYREAEQALAMGRKLLGSGITSHFTNLGLHRLLFAVAQHQELGDFYEDTVGTLVAYDARTGGDLMSTLSAFFACHGSPTETAQRLHLHRNTVLYRLRRIEEVGGLSLDDAATRLNLHLCLHIRDVLQVAGGRQRVPENRAAS
ncbi:MAG TPA: helix-turn-helix domain-containing protein [Candidatus Dormibacteraeota bacterium]